MYAPDSGRPPGRWGCDIEGRGEKCVVYVFALSLAVCVCVPDMKTHSLGTEANFVPAGSLSCGSREEWRAFVYSLLVFVFCFSRRQVITNNPT